MEKETKNLGFFSAAETSSPQVNNNRVRKSLLNYRLQPVLQLHSPKRPAGIPVFQAKSFHSENSPYFVKVSPMLVILLCFVLFKCVSGHCLQYLNVDNFWISIYYAAL